MPVVAVALRDINFLHSGERTYTLLRVGEELLFVDNRCPHRGGPLHLGALCEGKAGQLGVRCPWHQTFVPVAQLRKTALPMVWRASGHAHVVVPAAETTAMLRHAGDASCPLPCAEQPAHAVDRPLDASTPALAM